MVPTKKRKVKKRATKRKVAKKRVAKGKVGKRRVAKKKVRQKRVASRRVGKKKVAKKKQVEQPAAVRVTAATPPPAKRKQVKKRTKRKATCFVIMPFGDWFDEYYTNVYAPAIRSAGLEPERADDLYRPSAIINDIWSFTKKAKLIVADLTGKNPNVFYELGLAHACGKPAVLLTESMDDVPFDLRALRVLEYDKNDPNWGTAIKGQLKKAVEETLDSPLSTVLPTFLDEKDLEKHTSSLTADQKKVVSLQQDLESLRREVRTRSHHKSRRKDSGLGPQRAQELIRDFLKAGLSEDEITSTLRDLGAPARWIERRIQELKG